MSNTDLCKKCKKRKLDFKQGIICKLTNEKPNFEKHCADFENDETIKEYKGLDLKSNEKRAKALLLLIWIVLGVEIISLISGAFQYNLLQIVSNGGTISNETANANDLRELIINTIYSFAYLASSIAFIMWFRRAYFNLHQKVEKLAFSEGWAAGSWFVPIISLYRPYQIMKELYEETRKYIINTNTESNIKLTTKFLGYWWTLWLISGILAQINLRYSRNADTLSELLTTTTFNIFNNLIGIVLAFITIKIIKDYSEIEGLLITKSDNILK